MKTFILLTFISLICLIGTAQKGVNFRTLTFEEAVKQAKAENKFVFVDCYTSWCGPCKQMADNVFPQKKAGDYFNAKFVCVKYDMEKGEGPDLSKRFEIRAYPTFVIVNAEGQLVHKIVGGSDADGIIQRVEDSFDETKAFSALQSRYEKGGNDKELSLAYLNTLLANYDTRAEGVAAELMALLTEEEKISETYWFIYKNQKLSPEGSLNLEYLLTNYERFYATIGKDKVNEELGQRYAIRLWTAVAEPEKAISTPELTELSKNIAKLKLENDKELQAYINLGKALNKNKISTLIKACEREFDYLDVKKNPFFALSDRIMKVATPAEKARWIKIGEKWLEQDNIPNKGFMEACLKHLRSL